MEVLFDSLLQHWPGMVFRQRPDLTFEFASPRIKELTAHLLEHWRTQPGLIWEVIHELDIEAFKRHLREVEQTPEGASCYFRLRDAATGRVTYISEFRRAQRDASGKILCHDGFWLDVTRQTISERRLASAAWKETIGLLTLGLAHDFNNLLAGILGLSETFLSQIPKEHPFYEGLSLVKRNTHQAAELISRIAQLHRGKTGTRAYHNLNDLVKEGVDLLGNLVPKRIEVGIQTHPAQLPVYADAVEFQQVLINLAMNAAEAMPERGKITIRTTQLAALPALVDFVGAAPRLPAACIEIADSGHGIKPRLLPFIFDPFFTTKPMNRGSGLGLYNARLFVEKHEGMISVTSSEGVGATFQVWLPVADFSEADLALDASNRRRRSLLLAGQKGEMLNATVEFLRQNNYHVVLGGENPEDLLRSSDYQFDGMVLLAEPRDILPLSLTRFVRQQQLPIKVIVKTVGCNPDELNPQLFGKTDLLISSDTPEDAILDQLASVFELPGRA